ncbi:2Fe-2S iron-sulfur cluster-binding protein [Clostridium sp. BJN0013]|uniref:2Fe-2S iron-sulfur cluster-binding protein n=1 Tax=Clostridium sp. BJN0013 TaxID=3236840 RepID=UPI0034C6A8C5
MKIVINGKDYETEKGDTILKVARRNNIYIPTLCHSDALPGLASCRLCIVEIVDGEESKIVASCISPANPANKEIEVMTDSNKIKRMRRTIAMLLQARCPDNKEIEKFAKAFKVEKRKVNRFKLSKGEDCVLCGLCVKACKAVGIGVLSLVNKGIYKKLNILDKASQKCIGCGSCANVCPTNAIKIIDKNEQRKIWGNKFKMVKCDCCGEYFATEDHIKYAYDKLGIGQPEKIYCSKCKRKHAVRSINNVFESI